MSRLIFKTIHGSHLYGLAHTNSDQDFYEVYDRPTGRRARWGKQSIVDGVDTMKVEFGTWLQLCTKGVPQALEAMFSEMATVDEIEDFRRSFVVGTGVVETYVRTIEAFLTEDSNYKQRRHGLRLAYNCHDLTRRGRFNPTLIKPVVLEITGAAHRHPVEELRELAVNYALN